MIVEANAEGVRAMLIAVLTAEQVADALGCEAEHVNALAAAKKLPAVKFGRSWRFPIAALNDYLARQAMAHIESPPAPQPSITARSRGKSRPDLMRAAQKAGMSTDDQLNLIRGEKRTS